LTARVKEKDKTCRDLVVEKKNETIGGTLNVGKSVEDDIRKLKLQREDAVNREVWRSQIIRNRLPKLT